MVEQSVIAYFSMEIGLQAEMPTYSGGLGVLAGDTIRSSADLKIPMVAVSLLYRKGYFYQKLDENGRQVEEPVHWPVDDFLEEISLRAFVTLEGRKVLMRAWKYEVIGVGGFKVPVYFIDTNVPENSEWDRTITDCLYGGDSHYRLCQEVILGIGGVRILRALGYECITRFHMNEGHAAFLTLELLNEEAAKAGRRSFQQDDVESVREKCVFTTHTPVPSGHDQFPMDLVRRVFVHHEDFINMKDLFCLELASRVIAHRDNFSDLKDMFHPENTLNMTYLALNLSRYVNGVAKKHGEVSKLMFAEYSIDAITNGVHAASWVSRSFKELYDRYISGWAMDNFSLRYALNIPKDEMWQAHIEAKKNLINYVNLQTNIGLDQDIFTIGFARRAAAYKRGDLLFHDTERLKKIASQAGPIQIIYAGKAHPRDEGGKEIIRRIFQFKDLLKNDIKVVYLENYAIDLGKMMCSGVDLWLNTPKPPLEASGTSGMKAALNGIPSLSMLDGWWIEGCIEGVTGWAIDERDGVGCECEDKLTETNLLYDKLEHSIIPMFYDKRDCYIDVMKHAVALNGSFFNTHRMIQQYVLKAYFL